ncbi:hypothetical protein C8J57DRAFT_1506720 [Mycena rebaudengoi]|nr:hypothetical protein C8J57DRAFT_1506720 [Mycena rebaudengoi]
MSSDSTTSSPALLAPTPSTSTNLVGEALLNSDPPSSESESPPIVPWRTGADTPIPMNTIYRGHTAWRVQHAPIVERRRRPILRRRTRRKKDEIGISRDFFLIMALCFVLACLLIVLLRPIALQILWYIEDL